MRALRATHHCHGPRGGKNMITPTSQRSSSAPQAVLFLRNDLGHDDGNQEARGKGSQRAEDGIHDSVPIPSHRSVAANGATLSVRHNIYLVCARAAARTHMYGMGRSAPTTAVARFPVLARSAAVVNPDTTLLMSESCPTPTPPPPGPKLPLDTASWKMLAVGRTCCPPFTIIAYG
jgi:hypothetical protein